jgi:hypothetical protein
MAGEGRSSRIVPAAAVAAIAVGSQFFITNLLN